jgi:putative membrane protein
MDPTLRALVTSWDWRPEILLILAIGAALYITGWSRLRRRGRRHGRHQLASGWRLASYLGGLTILGVNLMSAIDILGSFFFFMHMLQHLLLIMVAPVLIWLGNPFPFFIWGLPQGRAIGLALLSRPAPFRALLQRLPAGATLILSVVLLWAWHDPAAYNAALRLGWVHDMQHLTFFLPAMLFWWKVSGAAPHLHGGLAAQGRIALLIGMAIANAIPGAVIALSPAVIYDYYLAVPRLWGLSAHQDQMIGGILMWIPGTMMYLLAALIILGRLLAKDERAVTANSGRGSTWTSAPHKA